MAGPPTTPAEPTAPERPPSVLDRALGIFTEVKGGEGLSAVLLAANVFLLLAAYYVIKPAREALILATEGGAEWKSYASVLQIGVLSVVVPAYGLLVARLARVPLIAGVTLFFTACLGAFYGAAKAQLSIGIVFYLWVGIFNLMIIAQFWALANDLYSREQGDRLFPLIGFGASIGAVGGSSFTRLLLKTVGLGVDELLLVAGFLLVISLGLTIAVDRRENARAAPARAPAPSDGPTDPAPARAEGPPQASSAGDDSPGAFRLLLRSRYLLLIAALMLLLNFTNTNGEYILGKLIKAAAKAQAAADPSLDLGDAIGALYASFFSYVNLAGMLIQLFVVSRIVKYLGVRVALLILPLIALGAYSTVAIVPVLAYVRWGKTAENATDYSLNNTVRNLLFLPLTRQEKYTAKQAIDTVFVRAGDVASAVLVFVGTTYLALGVRHFAFVNLGLIACWLVVAVLLGREYRAKIVASQAP